MAQHAKHSAIARYIEPARRSRNDVVTFQLLIAAAALTPPAVPPQYKGPELTPAARRPAPGR